MSAPPDLRTALDAMAAEAKGLDASAAERVVARGRDRRRRRLIGGVAALAGAAVALLLAASALLDTYGRAGEPAGTPAGVTYDPTVDVPWPWLRDLPARLDEPLALAYMLNDESSGYMWRVVSASGRQWLLPGSGHGAEPTLSADGWKLAWSTADQVIVRDLRDGSDLSVDLLPWSTERRRVLGGVMQAPWSADARYLALNAHVTPTGNPLLVVIDTETGNEIELPEVGVMGWLDADTMLGVSYAVVDSQDEQPPLELLAIELDGTRRLVATVDWPDVGTNAVQISPDARRLAGVGQGLVSTIDLTSGNVATVECACWGGNHTDWVSPSELIVRSDDVLAATQRWIAVDVDTGLARDVVTFSPRLPEVSLVIASGDVLATGPRGSAHASEWWLGWYLDWITYSLVGLGAIVALVGWLRARTRQRAGRDLGSGEAAAD